MQPGLKQIKVKRNPGQVKIKRKKTVRTFIYFALAYSQGIPIIGITRDYNRIPKFFNEH